MRRVSIRGPSSNWSVKTVRTQERLIIVYHICGQDVYNVVNK